MAPETRSYHISRGIRIGLIAFLALLPLIVSAAGSPGSSSGPTIEQSGGRISIVAEDATLGSIAEELSRKTGITVYLDRTEEKRKVSADVKQLSFEKGVRTLVHPLNYAIVADQHGRITELRIFKNTGTKESAFKVFTGPRTAGATLASAEPSRQVTPGPASPAKVAAEQVSAVRSSGNTPQPAEGLAGPSARVTGERAFQYSAWVNQRMLEAEQMRQSMRVKADQAEAQERQVAAVTAMTQASMSAQQTSAPAPHGPPVAQGPQTVQGAQAAMAAQQGQSQTQSFMQSNTQQRGYNNYTYYQQRAMRENISFYNMRRGQ